MHLIILCLLFLSPTSYANTYNIRQKNFSFKIEVLNDRITYSAPQTELSLVKKSCNEYLFQHFLTRTNDLTKTSGTGTPKPDTIEIQHNGKKYQLNKIDRYYEYFANFDQNFKTLKIEENLICTP